jgi:hypothetical protein
MRNAGREGGAREVDRPHSRAPAHGFCDMHGHDGRRWRQRIGKPRDAHDVRPCAELVQVLSAGAGADHQGTDAMKDDALRVAIAAVRLGLGLGPDLARPSKGHGLGGSGDCLFDLRFGRRVALTVFEPCLRNAQRRRERLDGLARRLGAFASLDHPDVRLRETRVEAEPGQVETRYGPRPGEPVRQGVEFRSSHVPRTCNFDHVRGQVDLYYARGRPLA